MSRSLSLVLIAALAVACAPANKVDLPATMAVSPEFSPEDAETIFAAADAWSKATNGVADLQVVIGESGTIRVRPDIISDTPLAQTGFNDARADITIDVAKTEDAAANHSYGYSALLQDLAMHELGHAFGLDHEPGGLMNIKASGMTTVDEKTLRHFCENYACR